MQKTSGAIYLGIWLLGVLLLLGFERTVFAETEAAPVMPEGVFIDGVDVSGLTHEQAMEAVEAYMNTIKGYRIQLYMGDQVVTVTAGALGLYWSNPEVIDKALAFGRTGNIVRRYKAQKDLQEEPVRFFLEYGADEETIRAVLERQCVPLNREPQNATMTHTGEGFTVVSERAGITLETDEAVAVIAEYLSKLWRHGLGGIELPAKVTEAAHKAAELEQVRDILAGSSTDYSSSSEARAKNIETGTGFINGTVLYPGEEYSVVEALVPFTAENGYEPAPSYENGDVVDSYGGGICQVSTTLYMSVLRAELEVTERYNHSMIVQYVKPSMDAAIAEGSKDFKFVNNLDAPIYIEGYTDGSEIGFVIYGREYRAEGREVLYESETLETEEPTVVLSATQDPLGVVTQTAASHTGYRACLWKTVLEDGEQQSRDKVNESFYNMAPARYSVGVNTDDSTAAAEIRAAVEANDLEQVYSVIQKYS